MASRVSQAFPQAVHVHSLLCKLDFSVQVPDTMCLPDSEVAFSQIDTIPSQATSTEVWIYRNEKTKEAVIAFRGTSNPQDMMTDAALAMSAFSPGDRQPGKAPDEVAAELSDEDVMKGPLGGIFQGIKVVLTDEKIYVAS